MGERNLENFIYRKLINYIVKSFIILFKMNQPTTNKNYHDIFEYAECDKNNGKGFIYKNCILLRDMNDYKAGDHVDVIHVAFTIYGFVNGEHVIDWWMDDGANKNSL
jgi:hypothetical protein